MILRRVLRIAAAVIDKENFHTKFMPFVSLMMSRCIFFEVIIKNTEIAKWKVIDLQNTNLWYTSFVKSEQTCIHINIFEPRNHFHIMILKSVKSFWVMMLFVTQYMLLFLYWGDFIHFKWKSILAQYQIIHQTRSKCMWIATFEIQNMCNSNTFQTNWM